jgi:hypothetical protein
MIIPPTINKFYVLDASATAGLKSAPRPLTGACEW